MAKEKTAKAKHSSAKSLENDDDVEGSRSSLERQDGRMIKIGIGKTPIYILNSAYSDGFVHWIEVDGSSQRVVCGGGSEGKGWAPDGCPICKQVAALYKKAKSLESELGKDDPKVKKLRTRAYNMKGKYEAHFLIAAGEMVIEKTKDGKKSVPDYEDAKVGILSMTSKQFEDFTALRSDSEHYPFIKSSKDLTNRNILIQKVKKDGSTFATLDFIPSKSQSDPPEVEYEEDDFNLDEDFEIDEELLSKAADYVGDDSSEDDEEEEEDDDEDDDQDEEEDKKPSKKGKAGKKKSAKEAEDDFLDDVEDDDSEDDDEEADEKPKKGKKSKEEDSDDDDEEDDDFEDDDPDDEEEEKKPAKKGKKR